MFQPPETPQPNPLIERFNQEYHQTLAAIKATADDNIKLRNSPEGILSFYALFQAVENIVPVILGENTKSAMHLKDLALRGIDRRYKTNFHPNEQKGVKLLTAAKDELRFLRNGIEEGFRSGRLVSTEQDKVLQLLAHIETVVLSPEWPPGL